MASGKRDYNRVVVLMGVSSVDHTTPIPLKVDPTTGRLLCLQVSYAGNSSAVQPVKRDENRAKGLSAVTNDANKTVVPISVNPTSFGILMQGL